MGALQNIGNGLLAIVAGVIAVAIVSVIVGRNSKAPAIIQASGQLLTNVVSAAANPIANPVSTAATNGNADLNAFTGISNLTSNGHGTTGSW